MSSINNDIKSKFSITVAILVFYIVVIESYYGITRKLKLENITIKESIIEQYGAVLSIAILIAIYLFAYVIFSLVRNYQLFSKFKCPKVVDILLSVNLFLISLLIAYMATRHWIIKKEFYESVTLVRNKILFICTWVIPLLLLSLLLLLFICTLFCKKDC